MKLLLLFALSCSLGLFSMTKFMPEKTLRFLIFSKNKVATDLSPIKPNKNFNSYFSGRDERPHDETVEDVEKIWLAIYKMKMIKYLQDNRISEYEKLSVIEQYNYCMDFSKYAANLTRGGLLDDWKFDL